jgi:hypothetical protein
MDSKQTKSRRNARLRNFIKSDVCFFPFSANVYQVTRHTGL